MKREMMKNDAITTKTLHHLSIWLAFFGFVIVLVGIICLFASGKNTEGFNLMGNLGVYMVASSIIAYTVFHELKAKTEWENISNKPEIDAFLNTDDETNVHDVRLINSGFGKAKNIIFSIYNGEKQLEIGTPSPDELREQVTILYMAPDEEKKFGLPYNLSEIASEVSIRGRYYDIRGQEYQLNKILLKVTRTSTEI